MNRKRDLENVSLLYESHFGAGVRPSRPRRDDQQLAKPKYRRASGRQMETIKHLNKRGWSVNKLRTKVDGFYRNEVYMSKNAPESREEADELIVVDVKGNVNGQPFDVGFSNANEDEQTSDFGQELKQEAEDQNPVENLEDEETGSYEGKMVSFTSKPSLDQLKAGSSIETYQGKVAADMGETIVVDFGNFFAEIGKEDVEIADEDGEDLGPNQQPESWGDETMGEAEPGETSARFSQDTPDDPESGGSPNIDDPDEQEEKGIPTDLTYFDSDETDDDEPGKPGVRLFNPKTGHTRKESYNSHGDRDMTLLAENYLNIKRHE